MVNYLPALYALNQTGDAYSILQQVVPELKPLYSFLIAYRSACLGNLAHATYFLQSVRDSPFINPYSLYVHKMSDPKCLTNLNKLIATTFYQNDPWKHALLSIITMASELNSITDYVVDFGNEYAISEINEAIRLAPHIKVFDFYKAFAIRDLDREHKRLIEEYYKTVEHQLTTYYQPFFDLADYYILLVNNSYGEEKAKITNFITYDIIPFLEDIVKKLSEHVLLMQYTAFDLYFASREFTEFVRKIEKDKKFNIEQKEKIVKSAEKTLNFAEQEFKRYGLNNLAQAVEIQKAFIANENLDRFVNAVLLVPPSTDFSFRDKVYYLIVGKADRRYKEELCKRYSIIDERVSEECKKRSLI